MFVVTVAVHVVCLFVIVCCCLSLLLVIAITDTTCGNCYRWVVSSSLASRIEVVISVKIVFVFVCVVILAAIMFVLYLSYRTREKQ